MQDRTRRILKVFLASPGDLIEERRAAFAAVRRVNAITGRNLGWEVDLRGWEDTLPGYGRPQAIINEDVDDSDVFIGVLWRRWGQETGEYSSGFEEEFDRAMERRRRATAPDIAMFFRSLTHDERVDPGEQLSRVLEFKKGLIEDKSILFREFATTEEWANLLFEFLMTKIVTRDQAAPPSWPPRGASDVAARVVDAANASTASPLAVAFSTPLGADGESTETVMTDLALPLVGSVALVGPPGSGKSVGLVTIATLHALASSPRDLEIRLCETGGAAMAALRSLPHCVSYAGPDDLVALVPMLLALHQEVQERWRVLADAGASDRDQYVRLTGVELRRVLVIIDGIHRLDRLDRSIQRILSSIISTGRAAGVYVACSAPSRGHLMVGGDLAPIGRVVRLDPDGAGLAGTFLDGGSELRTILYLDPQLRELTARLQAQHGPPPISSPNVDLRPFHLDDQVLTEASLEALPIAREIGSEVIATIPLSSSRPVCIIGGSVEERARTLGALRRAIDATGVVLDSFDYDPRSTDRAEAERVQDWLASEARGRRMAVLSEVRDSYDFSNAIATASSDVMLVLTVPGQGWSGHVRSMIAGRRGTFLVVRASSAEQSLLADLDIVGPPVLGPSGDGVGWVVDSSRARPVVLAQEEQ